MTTYEHHINLLFNNREIQIQFCNDIDKQYIIKNNNTLLVNANKLSILFSNLIINQPIKTPNIIRLSTNICALNSIDTDIYFIPLCLDINTRLYENKIHFKFIYTNDIIIKLDNNYDNAYLNIKVNFN